LHRFDVPFHRFDMPYNDFDSLWHDFDGACNHFDKLEHHSSAPAFIPLPPALNSSAQKALSHASTDKPSRPTAGDQFLRAVARLVKKCNRPPGSSPDGRSTHLPRIRRESETTC
ncbi:MAG: hypothetical protein KDA47_20625, partial [Planctomycetales bacterium]|nr:hypothetical protein [Planctomycetales bacterium]